jgi:hypothetical protein
MTSPTDTVTGDGNWMVAAFAFAALGVLASISMRLISVSRRLQAIDHEYGRSHITNGAGR